MQAVSDSFHTAVRKHGVVQNKVEIKINGVSQGELKFTGGSVTESATAGVRRTMNLDVDPSQYDLLATAGVTLHPSRGFRYTSGEREYVALGVFVIDAQSLGHTADSRPLSLTCSDKWSDVQRARFELPEVTAGNALTEAVRMVRAAFTTPPAATVTATTDMDISDQVWEKDRAQAVTDIAKSTASEIFFDITGNLIVRPIPELASVPVWTVSVGDLGVQLENRQELSRLKTFNVVVAASSNTDGGGVFDPVIVADDDPASPTYVGTYGRIPFFWSSPLWETEDQARDAATAMLAKVRAPAVQVAPVQVPHPALECGDTVDVHLTSPVTGAVSTQRHLIESITTPLTVDGTQSLGLRSTNPEET